MLFRASRFGVLGKRRLLLEVLEERIVLDAAAGEQSSHDQDYDATSQETGQQTTDDGQQLNGESASGGQSTEENPLQEVFDHDLNIVLISNALSDIEALTDAAAEDALVVVYDAAHENLSSLVTELFALVDSSGEKIGHLAIVSHGARGTLILGDQGISSIDTLELDAAAWQALGGLLSEDARIDLYGCNIGQGDAGLNLVSCVASLTGAVVWASDDDTGSVLGADWDLETRSGESSLGSLMDASVMESSGMLLSNSNMVNPGFEADPVGDDAPDGWTVELGPVCVIASGGESYGGYTVGASPFSGHFIRLDDDNEASDSDAATISQEFTYTGGDPEISLAYYWVTRDGYVNFDSFGYRIEVQDGGSGDWRTVAELDVDSSYVEVRVWPEGGVGSEVGTGWITESFDLSDPAINAEAGDKIRITLWAGDGGDEANWASWGYFDLAVPGLNATPTTTGIDDVAVMQGWADPVINLWDAFADAEDSDQNLIYEVVGNTNPSIFDVNPPIINSSTGELTLEFASGVEGSSQLTIRATDTGGEYVETTFTATVAHSGNIDVLNPGFEDDSPGDGAPDGWTVVQGPVTVVGAAGETYGGYTTGTSPLDGNFLRLDESSSSGDVLTAEIFQTFTYSGTDAELIFAYNWITTDNMVETDAFGYRVEVSEGGTGAWETRVEVSLDSDDIGIGVDVLSATGWTLVILDLEGSEIAAESGDSVRLSVWAGDSVDNICQSWGYFDMYLTPNTAPTTSGIPNVSVQEDASDTVIPLWPCFADAEDSEEAMTYTVQNVTNGSLFEGGTPSIDPATGELTLNYAPDAFGSSEITIRARDTGGLWVEATFEVQVSPENDGPTVDSPIADVEVDEDASNTVIHLFPVFDDMDDADATLSYTVHVDDPSLLDSVTIDTTDPTDYLLVLDYADNLYGTTTVTVRATDPAGLWVEDTFQVTVDSVSDAPVASDFSTTVNEDTSVALTGWSATDPDDLAGGDTDDLPPDHITVDLTGLEGILFNTVTSSEVTNGSSVDWDDVNFLEFRTTANWHGITQFAYTVTDNGSTDNGGQITSAAATVTITVNSVSEAPIAGEFSASGNEDTPIVLTGWSATDPEDEACPGGGDLPPDHITVDLTGLEGILFNTVTSSEVTNGSDVDWDQVNFLEFRPTENWFGTTSFTYTVTDTGSTDNGGVITSEAATVTITVSSVSDAPVAGDFSTSVNEDASVALTGWSATDPDDLAGGDTDDLPPDHITVNLTGLEGILFNTATSSEVTNGSNVDWDEVSFLEFRPTANWHGSTQFTYTVTDNGSTDNGGQITSADATVTITVNSVSEAPIAGAFSASGNEDTPIVLTGWSATDPEDEACPGGGDLPPDHITVNLTGLEGILFNTVTGSEVTDGSDVDWDQVNSLEFRPTENWFGGTSFTYTVTDTGSTDNGGVVTSDAATVSITVSSVSDAPVAGDFSASVNEDTSVTLTGWSASDPDDLAGGDGDDLPPVHITVNLTGLEGTLFNTETGLQVNDGDIVNWTDVNSLEYRPDPNWHGTTQFSYTVTDTGSTAGGGEVTSTAATVSLTVNSVSDAPIAGEFSASGDEDTNIALTGWSATDPADAAGPGGANLPPDHITVNLTGLEGILFNTATNLEVTNGANVNWGDVNALEFRPNENWNGTTQFTYTVTDTGSIANGGQIASSAATVTITVDPVNDPPTSSGVPDPPNENAGFGTATFDISPFFGDIDGPVLTYQLGTLTYNGGLVLSSVTIDSATGIITFVSDGNSNGSVTVEVAASDGYPVLCQQSFTFTVDRVIDFLPDNGGDRMPGEDFQGMEGPLFSTSATPDLAKASHVVGSVISLLGDQGLIPTRYGSSGEGGLGEQAGQLKGLLIQGLFGGSEQERSHAWEDLHGLLDQWAKRHGTEAVVGLRDFMARLEQHWYGKEPEACILVFNAEDFSLAEWYSSIMASVDLSIHGQDQAVTSAFGFSGHLAQGKTLLFNMDEMHVADLFTERMSGGNALSVLIDTLLPHEKGIALMFDLDSMTDVAWWTGPRAAM